MADGRYITLISVLTCPDCGQVTTETMPPDNSAQYYQCIECGSLLTPEPGDCCVFCSYGSMPCPTAQKHKGYR